MGIFLQYFAALSSALGALCAGTALGWTSNLQNKIRKNDYGFEVDDVEFSLLSSMLNLGAACVCIVMGFMINWIGRRGTMLFILLPFILGWSLIITATSVWMLIIGRTFIGIACGGCCVSGPVYVGEIADKEIRGKLGSFFQLLITAGILFVYILGAFLSAQMTSAICGFLPILFGICIFFCPESPTYYIMKGRNDDAIDSLRKFRGDECDLQAELIDLMKEEELRQSQNILKALRKKSSRKAMLISFGLMFFQQLSGINVVIFYTTAIFSDAKIELEPKYATIIIGFIQVVATFVSTMIVDRTGRKILLILSGSFMALCTFTLGAYYYLKDGNEDAVVGYGWISLLSLCIFIIAFSLGFGPVSWIMIGEIFSSDVKGIAGSLAGTLNWSLAFIVTSTYSPIREIIGPSLCFFAFTLLSILGIFFTTFIVPETKGKSLTEIQENLNGK